MKNMNKVVVTRMSKKDERAIQVLRNHIRDIPNFPKQGILFKDITPLLSSSLIFRKTIDLFIERYQNKQINKIIAIEARGFILGAALAYGLKVGLIPVRKKNKLPYKTLSASYSLEYGEDALEIHQDALKKGEKALIIDDVLATGGTLSAVCKLVENLGAEVLEIACLIELTFLNGRKKLNQIPLFSLLQY